MDKRIVNLLFTILRDKILAGNLPFLSSPDTVLSHPGGILGVGRTGASGSGTPVQLSYNINKHYNQALFREKMPRRTI